MREIVVTPVEKPREAFSIFIFPSGWKLFFSLMFQSNHVSAPTVQPPVFRAPEGAVLSTSAISALAELEGNHQLAHKY